MAYTWAMASGDATPIGRRVVLGMLGLGALGVTVGARAQGGLDALLSPLTSRDPTGLSDLLPGGDHFRIYTVVDGFPADDPATYRLAVDGLVGRPQSLSLADLAAMPQATLVRDFQCVTGWRVPGVHWSGVRLADVLALAGVAPGGRALRLASSDGAYTESLTMAQALRPDVLVATSMLGGPVSRAHGGPVRLYVAPMYGYKSIKWLERITVVDRVDPGYWETVGNYDVDAWVGASNGRADAPT